MAFKIDEFTTPSGSITNTDKTRFMSFGFTIAPTAIISGFIKITSLTVSNIMSFTITVADLLGITITKE